MDDVANADKIALADEAKRRWRLARFPKVGAVVRPLVGRSAVGRSAVRDASGRPSVDNLGRTRLRRRLVRAACALLAFAGVAIWLLTAAGFDARLSAVCVVVFIIDFIACWVIIARAGRGRPPPRLRGIGTRHPAGATVTPPADVTSSRVVPPGDG